MEIVNDYRNKYHIDMDDISNILRDLNYEVVKMERELEVEKELNAGKDDIISELQDTIRDKDDHIAYLENLLEMQGISVER